VALARLPAARYTHVGGCPPPPPPPPLSPKIQGTHCLHTLRPKHPPLAHTLLPPLVGATHQRAMPAHARTVHLLGLVIGQPPRQRGALAGQLQHALLQRVPLLLAPRAAAGRQAAHRHASAINNYPEHTC